MNRYNILNASLVYANGSLVRVIVKVEISEGDIRYIKADTKPRAGYFYLLPNSVLCEDLLQHIAGYGMEVTEKEATL